MLRTCKVPIRAMVVRASVPAATAQTFTWASGRRKLAPDPVSPLGKQGKTHHCGLAVGSALTGLASVKEEMGYGAWVYVLHGCTCLSVGV